MKKTFQLQNLKCGGCKNTIINRLLEIHGVQNIAIDVENSSITLTYKDKEVFKDVQSKLSQIGYPIMGDANTVIKKATSYVSCAIGKLIK